MSMTEYHRSIAREFETLQDRVRNLVRNWQEDGRYKEAILKNVLRRFLPRNIEVFTGFVIRSYKERNDHTATNQIDLIVYKSEFPVLFQEGDFAIVPPEGVLGIIEVKTNLDNSKFREVIARCNKNASFICEAKKQDEKFFNGLFSYGGTADEGKLEAIRQEFDKEDPIRRVKYAINHVAISANTFIRRNTEMPDQYSLYETDQIAYPYFIYNLLEIVSQNAFGNEEYLWYSEDKEKRLVKTF